MTTPNRTFDEVYNSINAIEDTLANLVGFQMMLGPFLEEHTSFTDEKVTLGVYSILRQQNEDLSDAVGSLIEEIGEIKAAHDALMSASGIESGEDETKARVSESMRERRSQIIASQLADGQNAAQIALTMNLKKTTVERVIGQLVAGSGTRPESDGHAPPASGKAVNE